MNIKLEVKAMLEDENNKEQIKDIKPESLKDENLGLVIGNNTNLKKLLAWSKSLIIYNYTLESWTELEKIKNIAMAIIENNLSSQVEIDKVYEELNLKIKGLIEREEKKELKLLLNVAATKIKEEYEENSWDTFEKMFRISTEVYKDINVGALEVANLNRGFTIIISQLVYKIDKSKLEEQIAKAESLKKENYTQMSFIEVEKQLTHAKYILNISCSTQKIVDTMTIGLENAIRSLVKRK
ncbi:hypothetical protein JCM1393_04300 [Clostridium carnis]